MTIRFSKSAARILELAAAAAYEYKRDSIGTEQLLLALFMIHDPELDEVFESEGLTEEKFRNVLAELYPERRALGDKRFNINEDQLMEKLSPQAVTVLQKAIEMQEKLSCESLSLPLLALAIFSVRNTVAMQCIKALHFDPSQFQNRISAILRAYLARRNRARQEEDSRRSLQEHFFNFMPPQFQGMPGMAGMEFPSMDGAEMAQRGGRQYPNEEESALKLYGHDLTQMAREEKLDPIIGRDEEIERVMQILCRRSKNNPVLIGEPGVGKTAIAEGLARGIIAGEMPDLLANKRLISLDLTAMLSGAKYRGEFEERIKNVLDEAAERKDVILFIDELHTLIGSGAGEGGNLDAANIMKPMLARGEIQVIGATTIKEYRKYVEKDAALERRFQPVMVNEPSEEDAILILQGLRSAYEQHHKVQISDEAIEAAVRYSVRYISDRFLPDKAIDLIDEAASKLRMKSYIEPKEVKTLQDEIEEICELKLAASQREDYEQAAKLRQKELQLQSAIERIREQAQGTGSDSDTVLGEAGIADVVSAWTGIPVRRLSESDQERLKDLEKNLEERVIGQHEAVSSVAKAIRRSRMGLGDMKRPQASFLFMGNTGVGKTELAKALAELLFGDESAMIRLDMSEFMEKHSVAKLFGAPPGYVGYDEGGQLSEKVRRRPYSVILFDEIEKAHPDVFNALLQILDDGRMTDGQGRTVNFKNCIIIMTSNIGSGQITAEKRRSIGFTPVSQLPDANDEKALYGGRSYEEAKRETLEALRSTFRAEFINRIDEIIYFHLLDREAMKSIVRLMLAELRERTEAIGIGLNCSDAAVLALAERGFDPQYGARPLRREIQSSIQDLLSEAMLDGQVHAGDQVEIDYRDGQFVFSSPESTVVEVKSEAVDEANECIQVDLKGLSEDEGEAETETQPASESSALELKSDADNADDADEA
ncbi:MAG: ATP-dependent Clp protease ATP-binding subunit [Eubacteriales bacterium]|nr:ATP-dependent Clp protease ATP-binding subunit [Eubacteriales bacterium]